jgi:hypothetical protein
VSAMTPAEAIAWAERSVQHCTVDADVYAALLGVIARLQPMEQRARALAATPGLDGAAMTYQHAGRYVLGVA